MDGSFFPGASQHPHLTACGPMPACCSKGALWRRDLQADRAFTSVLSTSARNSESSSPYGLLPKIDGKAAAATSLGCNIASSIARCADRLARQGRWVAGSSSTEDRLPPRGPGKTSSTSTGAAVEGHPHRWLWPAVARARSGHGACQGQGLAGLYAICTIELIAPARRLAQRLDAGLPRPRLLGACGANGFPDPGKSLLHNA